MSTRSHLFFLVAMLFGLQFVGCSSKSKPEPSPEPEEAAIDYQGLYFLGNDGTGTGLYRTDSTGSLTLLLKDIQPNEVHSEPHDFVSLSQNVLFFTEGNTGRRQLWKTDGTEAGTTLVKDLGFSAPFLYPPWAVMAVNDQLFYFHDDKLWKSNGTEEGTVAVGDTIDSLDIDSAQFGYVSKEVYTVGPGGLRSYHVTSKNDLFVSDWTSAGLRLLTDRRCPDHPLLVEGDAAFYFVCPGDTSLHHQLWKSDSAGELLLADFLSAEPANLEAAGGNVYFSTCCVNWVINGTIYEHWQLWKYDGAQLSDVLVEGWQQPTGLIPVGDVVYFGNLWRSDGTEGGTIGLEAFPHGWSSFTPAGDIIYVVGKDPTTYRENELWKRDAAGTQLVKQFSDANSISKVTSVGRSVYFMVYNSSGQALWKSDGTEAGTVLVSNSTSTSTGAVTIGPSIGDTLFFFAQDDEHGRELWKSNAQGTALLKDIKPGPASSNPENLTVIGSQLYFVADDGVHGIEPWKTDGTTEGTVLVKDVGTVGGDTIVAELFPVKHQAYLKVASYSETERPGLSSKVGSLWRTDGTPEGAVELGDIDLSSSLAVLGDDVFFSYSYGQDPTENGLWKTNGTPEGTVQVMGAILPAKIVSTCNRIYFLDNARQLWMSDGEVNGRTEPVTGIDYADISSIWIWPHGDLLYFSVDVCLPSVPCDKQIWQTDGTTTARVTDYQPPGRSNEIPLGQWIMSIRGTTLWRSDGTEETAVPVKDFCAPLDATRCGFMDWKTAGNTLYVVVQTGILWPIDYWKVDRHYLWKSDGTEEGTVPLDIPGVNLKFRWDSFFALDDRLVFAASDGDDTFWSIWRSDGTAEGTMPLTPRLTIRSYDSFERVGQSVHFIADDGETGRELWKTDGTLEGTVRVTDLWPGKGSGARWWVRDGYSMSGILGRGP